MLIGEYQHIIDSKKRLALPSKFRAVLGKSVVITKGFEGCLVVYTEKEWKVKSDKLGKLSSTQMEARGLARVMLAGAMPVNLDTLGRILIPDYLKKYADLKRNVVICGLFNRLEVWDSKKWKEYREKTEKKFGDLASNLEGVEI